MTGAEHYAQAERLLREDYARAKARAQGWTVTPVSLTEALVHATLAVAAATALKADTARGPLTEWFDVTRGDR